MVEALRNNLVRVVITLPDGPARLELSVLDLDTDAGSGGAGVREPRRPLPGGGSESMALRSPVPDD